VIPYGKWHPVALKWGSNEELYRPFIGLYYNTYVGRSYIRRIRLHIGRNDGRNRLRKFLR